MKEQISLRKKAIVSEIKNLRSAFHNQTMLDNSKLNRSIDSRHLSQKELIDKSMDGLTNRQSEMTIRVGRD